VVGVPLASNKVAPAPEYIQSGGSGSGLLLDQGQAAGHANGSNDRSKESSSTAAATENRISGRRGVNQGTGTGPGPDDGVQSDGAHGHPTMQALTAEEEEDLLSPMAPLRQSVQALGKLFSSFG